MAQFPAGPYGNQSSKIRILMYVAIAAVVIAIMAVAVFLRGRAQEKQAQAPIAAAPVGQPPQAVATDANAAAKPASPAAANTAAAPAAMSPQSLAPVGTQTTMAEPNQRQLIDQAMSLLNQPGNQKIIEARDRLNELLPMLQGQERAFVKEQLSLLADRWLFNKQIFPEDKLCTSYKVSPGDALQKIGKNYNVPYETLMKINGIDKAESLQAGGTIKVVNGPFHARIYRSTFTMDIYLQNTYVKSFPVGLGKQGKETPSGRWKVGDKLIKPPWTDPDTNRTYQPEDPDYPLGSRWISLIGLEGASVGRKGFAIHGTNDPAQIGMQGSRGCIRLHNGNAVEVYNMLMQGVSLVDVVD
jgi:lipoprotein-anchoring transpeptidase ErfK/SrfK